MGTRGPVPKRSDLRAGHPREAQSNGSTTRVAMQGEVLAPELNLPHNHNPLVPDEPHPLVVDLYNSARESGQSLFYEPSDWVMLRLTLYELNEYLYSVKKSSTRFEALMGAFSDLMLTEGQRRRLRMEIDRTGDAEKEEEEHQARKSEALARAGLSIGSVTR